MDGAQFARRRRMVFDRVKAVSHRSRLAYFLMIALLAGCAYTTPQPGQRYTLGADPAFSPAERTDIAAALDGWRAWSDGLVDVELTDGDGDARIVREGKGTGSSRAARSGST